jgi:hypothetical protein
MQISYLMRVKMLRSKHVAIIMLLCGGASFYSYGLTQMTAMWIIMGLAHMATKECNCGDSNLQFFKNE